jgi:hypothetical protein
MTRWRERMRMMATDGDRVPEVMADDCEHLMALLQHFRDKWLPDKAPTGIQPSVFSKQPKPRSHSGRSKTIESQHLSVKAARLAIMANTSFDRALTH